MGTSWVRHERAAGSPKRKNAPWHCPWWRRPGGRVERSLMAESLMRGDQVPERSQSMAWQTIHGETVLLQIDGKKLMGLNEVGACVWDLADGTRSIEEIIHIVAAKFQTPSEEAVAV